MALFTLLVLVRVIFSRGEIGYAASFVEWYAEEAKRLNAEGVTSHRPGAAMMVTREPVGVVGVATPWNFPSAMLTRKADAQFDFDIEAAVAQTRENPVFYVQYAHARCRSVLRAAGETMDVSPASLAAVSLASLNDDAEMALMRRLATWPRLVEQAALSREPHRIAFFLYDLAGDFHMLWNRGREDAALRFIQAERPAETMARLALVAATALVIRSGLAVMGVEPVEEMR